MSEQSIDETTVDLWLKELLLLGVMHFFEVSRMRYMTIDHNGSAVVMRGYPTISHYPENCYDLPYCAAEDFCWLTSPDTNRPIRIIDWDKFIYDIREGKLTPFDRELSRVTLLERESAFMRNDRA
mgnify:CR=1 FL=1